MFKGAITDSSKSLAVQLPSASGSRQRSEKWCADSSPLLGRRGALRESASDGRRDHTLNVDVSRAATAVTNAAIEETSRQADQLMGGRPLPGSAEWEALSGTAAGAQKELATQLLHLRIELEVGIDPLGAVIGLRRWGVMWQQISNAAGASRQASYGRWGNRVWDVLNRYQTGDLGGPVAGGLGVHRCGLRH